MDQSQGFAGGHLAPASRTRGYTTWEQVAGYFDGDGSPKVHVGDVTLHVTVCWSDQDKELLEHISLLLTGRGVTPRMGEFRHGTGVYYELTVTEGGGNALLVLKSMLPFLDKKWSQIDAAISYLENRITGDAFIEVLNEAVLSKRRSSWIIEAKMPHTKNIAIRLARTKGRPGGRKLTPEEIHESRQLRETFGLTYRKLGEIYGIAESTMFRALKLYV